MALNCRIFRDEKGDIDFVQTPDGNRSKLFDTLSDMTGGNKEAALNLYALTELEDFKDINKAKLNSFKNNLKALVKPSALEPTTPNAEGIMFSKIATTKPTYYSNAIGAINNLSDKNPKNAQGWLKQLTDTQKNGGIKNVNQELEWIGLGDYLNSYVKDNNPKAGNIPASVVEDYVRANQVEVVDINKGGQLDRNLIDPIKNEEGNWDILYKGKKIFTIDDYQAKDREEAIEAVLDADVTWDKDTTKYSPYQLGEGENYREVLLTMPSKKFRKEEEITSDIKVELQNIKDSIKDDLYTNFKPKGNGYEVSTNKGEILLTKVGGEPLIVEDIETFKSDILTLINDKIVEKAEKESGKLKELRDEYDNAVSYNNEDSYRSSHWGEENILAHVRLNEKALPDGRKVLIVNEIQSDWAQEGRKKGFRKSVPKGVVTVI